MRVIVFFDLPVTTSEHRKAYRKFRNYLIKNGFMMMQESVYCKLVLNSTVADTVVANIRKYSPSSGIIQVMKITEKQYAKIEFIIGEHTSEILDNDKRLVIL
jgi:CRISPR-associated protein Cas2